MSPKVQRMYNVPQNMSTEDLLQCLKMDRKHNENKETMMKNKAEQFY